MELRDLDIETPGVPGRRSGGEFGINAQKRSLILKAAGALLLILLLFLFFGGRGGDRDNANELDVVKSRLDGLEKQLARFEPIEQKISSSERQIMELQASVNSLEMATRSLMLSNSMKDQTEKPPLASPPNQKAQSAASLKKAASVENRYHQVRRGETLFSIAKRYGMSPEELRRANHLSNNSIQPGQRLIVDTK